jgi:hypothetical protein
VRAGATGSPREVLTGVAFMVLEGQQVAGPEDNAEGESGQGGGPREIRSRLDPYAHRVVS